MKLRRGLLIVLEGNDRAGKTTQAFKLVEAFRNAGQPARVISFPDRATEIGSVINDYLRGEIQLHDNAVHLLFAANRWEKFDEMLKDLHTGVTLIVDRYSYSGVAYSSAKKGANFGWCCAPENGLLQPDLVFFFSCNVDKLETREGFGEEAFETNQFQNAVRQSYMKMMEDNWVVSFVNIQL